MNDFRRNKQLGLAYLSKFAEPREDQEEPCIYKREIIDYLKKSINNRTMCYRDALIIAKFMDNYLNYRYLSKRCIMNLATFSDLVLAKERMRDRFSTIMCRLASKYKMQPAAIRFNDSVIQNRDAPKQVI